MCLIKLDAMQSNRNIVAFLLLSLIFYQCDNDSRKSDKADINLYTWGNPNEIVLEKGYFHSRKLLDTAMNQLAGDTLIPVRTFDRSLIITKLEPLQMEMRTVDGLDDFYITLTGFRQDTFSYDIKSYIDKYFLILISKNSGSHVYQLLDEHISLPESYNISFPRYEIGGYAVGDEVDRKDIHVLNTDQFGSSLTETTVLKEDQDVLLKVVQRKYILEIKRINIAEAEAQQIISELSDIFAQDPDIELMADENRDEAEEIINYFWSENEVNVLLSKVDESGDVGITWSLISTNLVIANILNNFLEDLPEQI